MEKFKIDGLYSDLMQFSDFAARLKDKFLNQTEKTGEIIILYNDAIKNTESEIKENEASMDKCKNEIKKMEEKIKGIEASTKNVKTTYQNIVDAYSKTSEGNTKNLYSEIIETARLNCEDETEKNEREITRLNDDISAINNNITNFNKIIDELNLNLEKQKIELSKYNKTLDYLKELTRQCNREIDNIANRKDVIKHTPRSSFITNDNDFERDKKADSFVENTKKDNYKEEKPKENKNLDFDDSLRQIYDLTGYSKKEKKDSSFESDTNLENLFKNDTTTTKKESSSTSKMDEWEKILNSEDSIDNKKEEPKRIDDQKEINDLLRPYGTTIDKLKSLTTNKIVYKSGREIDFNITNDDLKRCINAVNSMDLKSMKVLGPEITILRKLKLMKEGKN